MSLRSWYSWHVDSRHRSPAIHAHTRSLTHSLAHSLTHSLTQPHTCERAHTYTHSDPRTRPHPRGVHPWLLGCAHAVAHGQATSRGAWQVAGLYDLVEAELCRGVRVNTVRHIYVSGLKMTIACRVVLSLGPVLSVA